MHERDEIIRARLDRLDHTRCLHRQGQSHSRHVVSATASKKLPHFTPETWAGASISLDSTFRSRAARSVPAVPLSVPVQAKIDAPPVLATGVFRLVVVFSTYM
jgi:hypothetical protein